MPNASPACRPSVLWRHTQQAAPFWEQTLGASQFLLRTLRHGVLDLSVQVNPRFTRFVLPEIQVPSSDSEWLTHELTECVQRQVYEELTPTEAWHLHHQHNFPISSAFIVTTSKRRLVVNFARQSELFAPRPVNMETLESFAVDLMSKDHLMSFDIEKGYHHFRLHPRMRNWFVFRIAGRFFRCIGLPFGWRFSPFWFIKLMRPFVEHVRSAFGYRVHPYMDDFLVAPSAGLRPASAKDIRRAQTRLSKLLQDCGLQRKIGKGCWEGSQRLDHLGFTVDTSRLVFEVSEIRLLKLRDMAKALIRTARRNRRIVPLKALRSFCGLAISCTLAMPLARFYTRSLYDSMTNTRKGSRIALSHQAMKDLLHWQNAWSCPPFRPITQPTPTMAMHSDASTGIGQCGTLGFDLRPGQPGKWEARGLWDPIYRTKHITLLELIAVKDNLLAFESQLRDNQVHRLRLWEDNQAVQHIVNGMVSRSPELMSELRCIHAILKRCGLTIEAKYLPSAVNQFADRLSRLIQKDDWRLNTTVVQAELRLLPPTIDRFADSMNRICPRFNSAFHMPHSEAVDALQQDWGFPERNFWNPSLKLLPLVVRKIQADRAAGNLITPRWSAQPWWPRLCALATSSRTLPSTELFLPPTWANPNFPPPKWRVQVWCINQHSNRRCATLSPPASHPPQVLVKQEVDEPLVLSQHLHARPTPGAAKQLAGPNGRSSVPPTTLTPLQPKTPTFFATSVGYSKKTKSMAHL